MSNQTQEALKMAIEYLTNIQLDYKGHEVRKACKEALAQPQPKLFLDLSNSNGNHPVQPAQEPVAVCKDSIVNWVNGKAIDGWLYTHPAPSWQGLSNYDILSIDGLDCVNENDLISFAHAVVAKLKEKNHGI